jgi:hypothetical protein
MPDVPDEPDNNQAHRRRPVFQNVVTTGNMLSLVGTAAAMLPILSLVYEIGSWTTSIEARISNLQSSIASVAQLEQEDQKQLTELRVEMRLGTLAPSQDPTGAPHKNP